MNANDLIEAYVRDVAERLPRKQRNDVAFELRALLNEELQGKADESGRPADAAMTTGLLQAFGRPDEVAARYQPTLTIIDPSDGHAFLRASWIGLLVIWGLGLLSVLGNPDVHGVAALSLVGAWWTGVVVPSLWWPGVLVLYFGLAAWSRRRRTSAAAWVPIAGKRITGGRAGMALALVGVALGITILIDPRWILEVASGGRAAPAAYAALTYTPGFLQRQAPVLLGLLVLNIPLFLAVIVQGRWTPRLRQFETMLGLATCAAMLWTVFDGPVLMVPAGNQLAKFLLLLIAVIALVAEARKLHRRVTPAPN